MNGRRKVVRAKWLEMGILHLLRLQALYLMRRLKFVIIHFLHTRHKGNV